MESVFNDGGGQYAGSSEINRQRASSILASRSTFNSFNNFRTLQIVKKQYGQARKMTKMGNVENPMDHVNSPQDAAFLGGHALNESYKVPAASPMGMENGSYVHPLGKNAHRENAHTASFMPVAKMVGKNPAKNAGKGPIV